MKKDRTALRKLELKADCLAQNRYKEKNPYCLVCGSPTSNMHHVIFKSQSNYLRYSEKNLVPLCMKCHFKLHNIGDSEILGTIIKKKGMKWFDTLQQERHKIQKMNKGYLEGIIESLSTPTPF